MSRYLTPAEERVSRRPVSAPWMNKSDNISLGALPSRAMDARANRILIVDDNLAIHEDFRKVLAPADSARRQLLTAEDALFEEEVMHEAPAVFEVDSAFQGQEALQKVQAAAAAGRPYVLAFIDLRMPPGWDGIETITRLWGVSPELQIVICTAYSDYSWREMLRKLGATDRLVILKKPFETIEVLQLAYAFTRKWELTRQARLKLEMLSSRVDQRTGELENANAELKREIQERLQAERQLRHAQKMEAIGQLAAGVAHDFNNILTVIHGHASMLLMRFGQEGDHVKSVNEIRQSAERATNLVRQLLMFSRKQVLQFRNVELGEVVRSVSGMLRQLVGEHITLQTECDGVLPQIFADRGMVEQIIVNLTINARDAMPRGGSIRILGKSLVVDEMMAKSNPEARAGHFVCLSVSDAGCGMDAKAVSHLFEPFYTTKEVGKGTGLGLATVYGIVKQHQGWIDVQTQVNAGSTFTIYFPIAEHVAPRSPEPHEDSVNRSGTETILIAEDEPSLRDMVGEVLRLRGYRVLAADSGPAAMEVAQHESGRIDLLLTDMVMPGGMMGTELAGKLKQTYPAMKIIYTTGHSPGTAGLEESFREGIDFLLKPYSPNRLADVVRKSLDGHS
jgi:two-component system NtrC family sensor kinase